MRHNTRQFGLGDPNFCAITIHDAPDGQPLKIEIANAGRSGSQFYQPDAKLIAAVTSLTNNDPGRGGHVAAFAKAITSESFYVKSSSPSESTETSEGANRAMSMVHTKLVERGLLIPTTVEKPTPAGLVLNCG